MLQGTIQDMAEGPKEVTTGATVPTVLGSPPGPQTAATTGLQELALQMQNSTLRQFPTPGAVLLVTMALTAPVKEERLGWEQIPSKVWDLVQELCKDPSEMYAVGKSLEELQEPALVTATSLGVTDQ